MVGAGAVLSLRRDLYRCSNPKAGTAVKILI